MPIEELSIISQGGKNKSNKPPVFSKTSSVTRIFDLEWKTLKAGETQTRTEQKEIADLQEELARKARIAEKEIERAKASSSCNSSFRSISPVGLPDDNLT